MFENAKSQIQTRYKKTKEHVQSNQSVYTAGAVGVAIGAAVFSAFGRGQISISNPAVLNWKPVSSTVQVQMTRPGPRSFVVQCLETQETFPSLRQAAKSMDLSASVISGHLQGKLSDAGGYTFKKLSEI